MRRDLDIEGQITLDTLLVLPRCGAKDREPLDEDRQRAWWRCWRPRWLG